MAVLLGDGRRLNSGTDIML